MDPLKYTICGGGCFRRETNRERDGLVLSDIIIQSCMYTQTNSASVQIGLMDYIQKWFAIHHDLHHSTVHEEGESASSC